MRQMTISDRQTYEGMLRTRREGLRSPLTVIGIDITARRFCPAWMMVSSVYVYSLKTFSSMAALRLMARKPLGASGTLVLLAARTTQLPKFCRRFLMPEKCSMDWIGRAPITRSALPARMGAVNAGMWLASY